MKQILWYTTIVICVVFIVFSLVGIAGVWAARAAANGLVNGLFNAADQAVSTTMDNIGEMLARRQEMRENLQELSAEVDNLGSEIEETPVILTAIDKLMDGKLAPALMKLDGAGRRLYTGLSKVDTAVSTLNETRLFRNRDGLLDELAENLDSTLTDLDQLNSDFGILRTSLRERREEAAESLVDVLQGPIERMDTRLAESQARLERLNTRLAVAQSRLDATRQGLLQTILILAIILTAFMLWLIFTQYLAIRYALVRIHAAPEKKPEFPAAVPSTPTAVEPINEVVPAPVTEPTSPTGTVTAIAPEPVVPAPVVEEDVEPPLASEPVKSTKPTANKSAAKSTSKKASASKKPTKKGNKK